MEQSKNTPSFGIKQLAEDERPREKMYAHGASSLHVAELLAILFMVLELRRQLF